VKEEKHNRRRFLKVAAGSVLAALLFIWNSMVSSDKKLAEIKKVTLPFDPNRDFIFHDDFIIVNSDKDLRVYSSRCTHLGCIIQQEEGNKLVCPCHGSKFNTKGQPERGPAIKPLRELVYQLDIVSQQITIEL
jgi:Rieske Fe-S protein